MVGSIGVAVSFRWLLGLGLVLCFPSLAVAVAVDVAGLVSCSPSHAESLGGAVLGLSRGCRSTAP